MSAFQDQLEQAKIAKQCGNKRRYESRALAKHGIKRMVRAHGQAKATYGVYECPHCSYWHVGHKPKRK